MCVCVGMLDVLEIKPEGKGQTEILIERKESEWMGRRMLRSELRCRGRAKRSLMDVMKEDIKSVGVREGKCEA